MTNPWTPPAVEPSPPPPIHVRWQAAAAAFSIVGLAVMVPVVVSYANLSTLVDSRVLGAFEPGPATAVLIFAVCANASISTVVWTTLRRRRVFSPVAGVIAGGIGGACTGPMLFNLLLLCNAGMRSVFWELESWDDTVFFSWIGFFPFAFLGLIVGVALGASERLTLR